MPKPPKPFYVEQLPYDEGTAGGLLGVVPNAWSAKARNVWAAPPTISTTSAFQARPEQGPAPTSQKKRFFRQGGPGQAIVGSLADYLAQLGGGQGAYAPAMEHQREIDAYTRKRNDDLEDYQRTLKDQWDLWRRQEEYKRQFYPQPNQVPGQ